MLPLPPTPVDAAASVAAQRHAAMLLERGATADDEARVDAA